VTLCRILVFFIMLNVLVRVLMYACMSPTRIRNTLREASERQFDSSFSPVLSYPVLSCPVLSSWEQTEREREGKLRRRHKYLEKRKFGRSHCSFEGVFTCVSLALRVVAVSVSFSLLCSPKYGCCHSSALACTL